MKSGNFSQLSRTRRIKVLDGQKILQIYRKIYWNHSQPFFIYKRPYSKEYHELFFFPFIKLKNFIKLFNGEGNFEMIVIWEVGLTKDVVIILIFKRITSKQFTTNISQDSDSEWSSGTDIFFFLLGRSYPMIVLHQVKVTLVLVLLLSLLLLLYLTSIVYNLRMIKIRDIHRKE